MPEIPSPVDGRSAGHYDLLDWPAALARLEAAEQAQRQWQTTPLSQRVELCRAMLDRYGECLPENAEAITKMMGKPIVQARSEFQRSMRERVEYLCDIAETSLADEWPPERPGFRRYIRKVPVGVVLDIAAWNYPLLIAINVVVPAVLAGNSVLLKHSSQTALVADQIARAFSRAGAPEGLVQAFHVDHGTCAELIDTRRFGFVAFTGSVRGGHEIYRSVAQSNFVGVSLELGGKDAALVLPDAPFESTVENLVDGAFYNAGQSCCAIERIYVPENMLSRFCEAFVALTRQYRLGNPLEESTTLGPLVSSKAVATVRGQIEQARRLGARCLLDSTAFQVPDLSPCYMAPHVLDRVDHSMELMTEETFGPAIGIMAYRDIDEGVALVNDSRYGLTASVWSSEFERGEAVAQRLQAGTVYLNRCDYLDPGLCWTGIKDSGFGCSLSRLGFNQVTRPKSFHLRVPT